MGARAGRDVARGARRVADRRTRRHGAMRRRRALPARRAAHGHGSDARHAGRLAHAHAPRGMPHHGRGRHRAQHRHRGAAAVRAAPRGGMEPNTRSARRPQRGVAALPARRERLPLQRLRRGAPLHRGGVPRDRRGRAARGGAALPRPRAVRGGVAGGGAPGARRQLHHLALRRSSPAPSRARPPVRPPRSRSSTWRWPACAPPASPRCPRSRSRRHCRRRNPASSAPSR